MENIIKCELCPSCKHKCKTVNQQNIILKNERDCKIYKCLAYELDITKVHPYMKFNYCVQSNNDKVRKKVLTKKGD